MRAKLLFLTMLGLLLAGCEQEPQGWHRHPVGEAKAQAPAAELKVEVPPPPFSEGAFPCTECHDPTIPVNTRRRKLEMAHEDVVLNHDEEHRWCFDCHAETNRDKLRLASGEQIDFTESYRLCGQCHGPTLRNWKAGEHGKRTGSWSGEKQYLLCASCHSPHSPGFKPLKPQPAPVRQEAIK